MNIRDFRYLIALKENGSFRKAADACFVSQPTLSGQIKKLEELLGMQLVDRSRKAIRITEGGERIIESAYRIVHEVDNIKTIAKSMGDPAAGNFKLGGFPTLAPYLFPELVPFVRQALPRLRLILLESKTDELLTALEEGKLDAALLALPVDRSGLVAQPLFDDPFVLAVEHDNPLARKKIAQVEDLSGQHLLLLEEGHCLRDQALDFCHRVATEEENFRATSLETLRQMVRAGTGVTLIPQIAVDADHQIRYIPFCAPAPKRVIGLVWKKGSYRETVMDKLAHIIRNLPTMPPESHYLPHCELP